MQSIPPFFVGVAMFSPMAVGLAFLAWRVRRVISKSRWPILQMDRRPAGESTRLRIEKLNEKGLHWMMVFAGFPGLVWISIQTRPVTGLVLAISFALVAAASAFSMGRIWTHLKRLRDEVLGFEGERYVGGMLDELMREGFEVFHDVPFDGFNIDHVVLGPAGVYAVETKTRRKSRKEGKGFHWSVTFTGDALEYPWAREAWGLEQALRNAGTLGKWINDSTDEKVVVQPVLVLPGWMVERKGRGQVAVINPNEARKFFVGRPSVLAPATVKRIAFQLRQKSAVAFG